MVWGPWPGIRERVFPDTSSLPLGIKMFLGGFMFESLVPDSQIYSWYDATSIFYQT